MVKRIIGFFVAFLFVIGAPPVFAADSGISDEEFFSYMNENAQKLVESIDISSFARRRKWKLSDVSDMLQRYYLQSPELFYVNNNKILIRHNEENYVYKVDFEYLYTQEKVAKMLEEMREAAQKATEGITEDMSDVEKALAVHDYIILNNSYDHSLKKYTAYDCLVGKSSTCQGYTLAYIYIMRDFLGVDCSAVISDSQNHSWNYLKLDGKWYHVDLTSDDVSFEKLGGSEYDGFGEVSHANLLMSDAACKASSTLHRNWKTFGLPAAESTLYDSFFWKNSKSPMAKYGDLWYYVDTDMDSPGLNYKSGGDKYITSRVCAYSFASGKSEILTNVQSEWYLYRNPDTGKKYNKKNWYKRSFTKVALCGNSLFFNSADEIYRINLKTGKMKTVYKLTKSNMSIYSVTAVSENKLKVCYKRDLSYSDRYFNLLLA